ncbi:hypothetical protein M9H77_13049 [Catharanthus roseus]|uniref:Uncharacterized protein n=1 Tax=Catharanthus roseus TaxID=4058 RepID=A0ACC0BJ62_CATRO|nr:hypothetical protein M9H77_13049 [Catharanthus roseus]
MACYYQCRILEELKPTLMLVITQIASGGASIFYKFALVDGMKMKILILYRLVFATAFITPLALFFERNTRPKMTWRIALEGFISGLLGAAYSIFYGESLKLTSATYASAMSNLIPAVTFLMAIIFRLERLDIRSSAGKAKIVGTGLSIGGAMILTSFKGIKITIWSTHINLLHHKGVAQPKNHLLGSLLVLLCCFSYASWLIVQAKMSRRYPCYSSTALMSLMGLVLTGVYSLCTENKNWSSWKLAWNIRLLAAAYSGIVSSGVTVVLAWCTKIKGPLVVSSFTPLGPVFVAIVGSLCLDEKLYLGSIIGSILIILGLYIVLWGKGKETKTDEASGSESKRELLDMASFSTGNHVEADPTFSIQTSHLQSEGGIFNK